MDYTNDDVTSLQQEIGDIVHLDSSHAQKMKDKQSNSMSSRTNPLKGLRVSFADAEDVWKRKSEMAKTYDFENK